MKINWQSHNQKNLQEQLWGFQQSIQNKHNLNFKCHFGPSSASLLSFLPFIWKISFLCLCAFAYDIISTHMHSFLTWLTFLLILKIQLHLLCGASKGTNHLYFPIPFKNISIIQKL